MLAAITIVVAVGSSDAGAEQHATSTYTNPQYGVSFQYPRTYQLSTGEEANLSWGYLGQVEANFLRPGGVTLAAVELPPDSYPGTDFNLGLFAVRINSGLDASECDQFSHPNPDQPEFPPPLPTKAKVGANEFAKAEDGQGAMMKQAASEYYHIYRNDICYEFELGLGTAGFEAVDGMKQVDGNDVFRKLKAILATVKIAPVNFATVARQPTRIHSFDTVLVKSAKPNTYRISWDVPSVPLNTTRLEVPCGDEEFSFWQTVEGQNKESALRCGDPITLTSNSGSLLVRFKSDEWTHPQLTLTVEGKSAVSKTRVLVVSPSPAIKTISGGECEDFDNQSLIPGYEFLISGNGFTGDNNIVRIGPLSLNLSSSDNGQFITTILPKSFALGHSEISVENALGKSDEYGVDVIPPPPPQNVTPGASMAIHRAKDSERNAPWPMLGGAPSHAGFSSYAVAKSVALRWKFTAAAQLSSPPVVGANETTYVASADGYLYAVNLNGAQKWSYKTCSGPTILTASPALSADGTIYVISQDQKLYAINSDDGTLKWKYPVGGSIASTPTVGTDGTVYAACDNDLCAISPDGARKWRFQTHFDSAGLTQGSPAISQTGPIYVAGSHCNESGVCSGELLSVNPDGTRKWRFATVGAIESSPVVGPDGSIYVVDSKRDETMAFLPSDLYAVSPKGTLKWKFSGGERSTYMPIPVVGPDGSIYAASGDCNLYVLNREGLQEWTLNMCPYGYSGGNQIPSPVVDANGTIYIGSIDYGPKYNLLAIGRDRSLLWTYFIGESHESVPGLTSAAIGADGTIYIGSNNYSLYALGKPLNAPLPTPAPVAGQMVLSPDKFDFFPAWRAFGSVRVTASSSNKLPITLEQYSVSGGPYWLERTNCQAGQLLYPGEFCDIGFSYSPGMRKETRQIHFPGSTTTQSGVFISRVPITGEPDYGDIVVSTNAQDVKPPNGRVTLVGRGKIPATPALRSPSSRPARTGAGVPSP